ncbi:hypothetical protein [Macrococcus lamae]|uniref:Uncharacterized protein n=1 Tax=Macrococcus lamae TaxID=198484 RepID=A0A4R6BWN5_9STAP|nr:hypothetical protein [Macrococcus lamae]TDM12884.1 hypothetical protein ERX29_02460 [Macrococcus lamae]
MKVIQKANCNNSPKNQTIADLVKSILLGDELSINNIYAPGLASINLPEFKNIDEMIIETAISHGKVGSSLCSYQVDNAEKYIGFFIEFKTHKAKDVSQIIVTAG